MSIKYGVMSHIETGEPFIKHHDRFAAEMYLNINGAHHLENLPNLFDLNNWNLEKLFDSEKGRYRKPKITLYFEVTSKGNLALEWLPYGHSGSFNEDIKDTDFTKFSFKKPYFDFYTGPWNRLFLIKEFSSFMRVTERRPKVFSFLWELVESLIAYVKNTLSDVVDFEFKNHIVIEYKDRKNFLLEQEVKSVDILGDDELRLRKREKEKNEWINQWLKQGMGLKPNQIVQAYIKNDQVLSKAAKELLSKANDGAKLSPAKLKSYLLKLAQFDPDTLGKKLEGTKLFINIDKRTSTPTRNTEQQSKWDDLTREQLEELVWSKPRLVIGKDFGVSDNAVTKKCKKLGIKTPKAGFWRQVEVGKIPQPNGKPV